MKQYNNPLVSVIIPVFNGASFLVEAIESVQKSTFRDFEIILVDDGSTDNSHMVCRMLDEKYSNLHFYDFAENKGLGKVLNFALKKARGTYICRLNQDDRMLRNRMKKQVGFLQKHPDIVAVGSHIRHFYEDGRSEILKYLETDAQIKKIWHIVGPFSDPSVMYRKDIALQVGGYDQSFWPVEPCSLWLQIFWVLQLAAGMIFTAKMNWKAYRSLKHAIAFFSIGT